MISDAKEAIRHAREKWPNSRDMQRKLARAILLGYPNHYTIAAHRYAPDQLQTVRCVSQ
jgi:hypothetical protein